MRALTLPLAAALLSLTGCPPEQATLPDPSPAAGLTYPIVATGQAGCYDTAGQIDCTAGPLAGQDAQYQGHAARYTVPGDGTVVDEITGLVWTQAHLGKASWTDAWDLARGCAVGGYDDWRLPTLKELYSLIDFDGTTNMSAASSTPYLDTAVFAFDYGDEAAGERFIDAQYWSATEYVGTTMNGAHTVFGVNFADGRIKGYPTAAPAGGGDKLNFVRLVRGNPAYGVNDLEATAETVLDRATGLEWMRDDAGQALDWPAALAYCEGLVLAGHDDWRLPDAKSLQSIVDYGRSPTTTDSAAIDPVFGVSDPQSYYWTSTTHRDGPPETWGRWAAYVAFGQAFGYMQLPGMAGPERVDVHGAGAQRGDPKVGDPADWAGGHGPQGDDVRIFNAVRCVRGGGVTFQAAPPAGQCGAACVGGGQAPADPGAEDPFEPPPGEETPGQGGPPPPAIDACEGLRADSPCQFTGPGGAPIRGTCQPVPEGVVACVPEGGPPAP